MSIYIERKQGKPTGTFVVEVNRNGTRYKHRVNRMEEAKRIEAHLKAGNTLVISKDSKQWITEAKDYRLDRLAKDACVVWLGTKDEKQSCARLKQAVALLGTREYVRNIKTSSLEIMVNRLKAKGKAPGTINRYLSAIARALRWAKSQDIIQHTPETPWVPDGARRMAWLTEKQLDDILSHLVNHGKHAEALCVEVLVGTGMRPSELLSLRSSQVLDDGVQLHDGETKNGEGRQQPLPEPLAASLKALVDSGLPSYRKLMNAFYEARDALGLPEDVTLYTLRHTTATRLTAAGESLAVVKEYMGHKSVNTTLRYIKVSSHTKRQASNILFATTRRGEPKMPDADSLRTDDPKLL